MRSPSAFGSKAHSVLPPLPECKSPRLSACDGCNRHDVLCTRQHNAGARRVERILASACVTAVVSAVARFAGCTADASRCARDTTTERQGEWPTRAARASRIPTNERSFPLQRFALELVMPTDSECRRKLSATSDRNPRGNRPAIRLATACPRDRGRRKPWRSARRW